MAEDVLQFIEQQLKEARANLEKAKLVLEVMRRAGEDTTKYEMEVRRLESKIQAYESALRQVRQK